MVLVGNKLNTEPSLFEPSYAFHIETGHLVFKANQTTDFCMKCYSGLN